MLAGERGNDDDDDGDGDDDDDGARSRVDDGDYYRFI